MKRPEKCYSLWCDWPGCDYQWEYGDFTIFGDGYDADEIVTDQDGWVGRDGKTHYCDKHLTVWASDYEGGELPAPPYLLIHDGDTEHTDDDGKVSLMEAVS